MCFRQGSSFNRNLLFVTTKNLNVGYVLKNVTEKARIKQQTSSCDYFVDQKIKKNSITGEGKKMKIVENPGHISYNPSSSSPPKKKIVSLLFLRAR